MSTPGVISPIVAMAVRASDLDVQACADLYKLSTVDVRRLRGELSAGDSVRSRNGRVRLQPWVASIIKKSLCSQKEIADLFGVSESTASNIRLGITWKNI